MNEREAELVRALKSLDTTEDRSPRHRRVSPVLRSNIFRHHDAHPLALATILFERFGPNWLPWHYDTLWMEISREFHTDKISDHTKQKVQAIRTALISDWVWTKWEVFCPVVQALNNNIPDFAIMRKPEPGQIMVTVDILKQVRDDEEYSDEVQGFCASSLLERGITYAPPPIEFCQDEIDRYLVENKIPAVPQDVGKRLREVEGTPVEEVELREDVVDVQVAKLLIARDYLKMRRSQLKVQLESMK